MLADKFDAEKDRILYGETYKTAAAKIGNQDANKLLAEWCKLDE